MSQLTNIYVVLQDTEQETNVQAVIDNEGEARRFANEVHPETVEDGWVTTTVIHITRQDAKEILRLDTDGFAPDGEDIVVSEERPDGREFDDREGCGVDY